MTSFAFISRRAAFTAVWLALASGAQAQTTGPNQGPAADVPITTPVTTPQTTSAQTTPAKTLTDTKSSVIKQSVNPKGLPGVRDGLVTQVGSGNPVGEGSRVLAIPGKCTPKANSLDCVSDSAKTTGGADVSGRVRNSVIGEVGAGKGATEGGGKAKGEKTCTPAPGKLTCEP